MKITKTKFKDLIIIEQEKFVDHRGELRITFHQKNLNVNKFLFEYSVSSKKNVIRGLHFQKKFQQAKLVYVLKGKILDIIYYKLSNYYKPEYEDGIIWNANDIKIKWPNGKKILSKKDLKLKNLKEFIEKHKSL